MKRTLALPLCVLAALLAFSLWNIRHMDGETGRWRAQLQQADRLALSGAWCETPQGHGYNRCRAVPHRAGSG